MNETQRNDFVILIKRGWLNSTVAICMDRMARQLSPWINNRLGG